jgi:hypothetical protein
MTLQLDFFPRSRPFALTGAFHDYVRGVFADRCANAARLHEARALWLRGLAQRMALQRWEGEGGSTG